MLAESPPRRRVLEDKLWITEPRRQSLEDRLWITEQQCAEEVERRLCAEQALLELTRRNEEQQAAICARDQRISELENLLKEALIQGAVLSKEVFALSKEKADAQVACLTEKRLGGERLRPVLEHSALVESDSSLSRGSKWATVSTQSQLSLCLLASLVCIVFCSVLGCSAGFTTVASVAAAILGAALGALFRCHPPLENAAPNSIDFANVQSKLVESESTKMRNKNKVAGAGQDLHNVALSSNLQASRSMDRHQVPNCSPRGSKRSPRFRPTKGGC